MRLALSICLSLTLTLPLSPSLFPSLPPCLPLHLLPSAIPPPLYFSQTNFLHLTHSSTLLLLRHCFGKRPPSEKCCFTDGHPAPRRRPLPRQQALPRGCCQDHGPDAVTLPSSSLSCFTSWMCLEPFPPSTPKVLADVFFCSVSRLEIDARTQHFF